MVAKNPAVAMLDVDLYMALRYEAFDGIGRQRAAAFPNSRWIFASEANHQRELYSAARPCQRRGRERESTCH